MTIDDLLNNPDMLARLGLGRSYDNEAGKWGMYDLTTHQGVHDTSKLQELLAQNSELDAQGRPRFGTGGYFRASSNRFGLGNDSGTVDLNGKTYDRGTGITHDEMQKSPQYAKWMQQFGVTPEDFIYDPQYGNLLEQNDRTGKLQAQLDNKTKAENAKNNMFDAAGKTIGFASGLSNLAGLGLSALAEGGSSLAASFLPEGGYQSLLSSLMEGPSTIGNGIGLSGAEGATTLGGGTGVGAGADTLVAEGGGAVPGISPYITGAAGAGGAATLAGAGGGAAAGAAGGVLGTGLTLGQVGAVGGGALALAGLAGRSGGLGGSTSQTSTTNIPPMSQEERDLINLNAELTKRQLTSIDQLAPFQQQMLQIALDQMQQQAAQDKVINGAVSPEEQAALTRQQYQSALKAGPMQDEILQRQLDTIRLNGAASPEQLAMIKSAADTAITSANSDIDANTSRGIGLISDELANSRGLRLSDSPMSSEAALLAREGEIQKGGVEKSLRANQANATLNYPLAVQGVQTASANASSQIAQAAQTFQQTLRQKAFENRMSITGNATSTGLGLASVGGGNAALSALANRNLAGATKTGTETRGLGLADYSNLAGGIGSAMYGYSRLFPG